MFRKGEVLLERHCSFTGALQVMVLSSAILGRRNTELLMEVFELLDVIRHIWRFSAQAFRDIILLGHL